MSGDPRKPVLTLDVEPQPADPDPVEPPPAPLNGKVGSEEEV